ncbi:MAG TPA: Slp family lipoprotein [Rhodanobacteraceae bacterium]|nr:Slp family lipoprotein [Rhodanobacteraceae bacterium]
MWKSLLAGGAALALAACATVPKPLAGQFQNIAPANAANANGTPVRWGGQIVETAPGPHETCIYALARPLDRSARPSPRGDSLGRFVACHAGFYDPEIFAKGREITVTGTLDGTITRKVGDFDYPYPKIAASNIFLWPLPQTRPAGMYDPYFYDPFWGPRFYDPFWNLPPRVIIVKPAPKPTGGK